MIMHKKILIRIILFILVAILLISACSFFNPKLPEKQYYIINYTPKSQNIPASQRPYPFSLQIGKFEVQRIFNRQNIIYRYSPNKIQYHELERWAVRPDYMIKDMVFKQLAASNLTNLVSLEFLDSRPDYRLEGTVEALEKYDAGDLFFAHLAMTFKMLDTDDGSQVWDYSFDRRKQVYSVEMVHTIIGLSSIFQTEMDIVEGQLDSLFLSLKTGVTLIPTQKSSLNKPARADSTDGEKLDESAFEIIPEKKK